jgi:uncharacterized protein
MAVYSDTSGLTKRYVNETGSDWLTDLVDPASGNDVYTVVLTAAELTAAIARRQRGRSLTPEEAAQIHADFEDDLDTDYQTIAVTDALVSSAMLLAKKHFLRGYDAVQLAAALEINRTYLTAGLPPILFVSADTELNAAARAEGLQVENPNDHP